MALKRKMAKEYIGRNITIAVSGYFIWLHIGHLDLFKRARELGNLIVIVNNDDQQFLKYNKVIVPLRERADMIKALTCVDTVVRSIDKDRTVCKTLERIRPDMFANGGDRTDKNIPEIEACERLGIRMIFGLGGKVQSSSELILKL